MKFAIDAHFFYSFGRQQAFYDQRFLIHQRAFNFNSMTCDLTSPSSCCAWHALSAAWWMSDGWLHSFFSAAMHIRCWAQSPHEPPNPLKHKIVQNNLIQPICMKIGIAKYVKEFTHLMHRLITLELSSCLYSFTWRSLGRQNNTSSTTMQRILNKRRSDCTMYSTRLVIYQFTF